jgi:hypothetical protein
MRISIEWYSSFLSEVREALVALAVRKHPYTRRWYRCLSDDITFFVSKDYKCLVCDKLFRWELVAQVEEHAVFHLKEHNLLVFT